MGLRQTHRCLLSFNKIKNKRFRKSVFQRVDECDREVVVAIASAERERETHAFTHKNQAHFIQKCIQKCFQKLSSSSSLSLVRTHAGERKESKRTHPYPPPWNCVAPSLPKLKLIIIVCAQKVW